MTDPTSVTVGRNLQRIRTEKNLTIRDVSVLLESADVKMGWTMISRTENGLRKVTVGELTALAASLEVSPVELLVPPNGWMQVTGFGAAPSRAVRDWMQVGGPLEDLLDSNENGTPF